jgi:hypothetical protein
MLTFSGPVTITPAIATLPAAGGTVPFPFNVRGGTEVTYSVGVTGGDCDLSASTISFGESFTLTCEANTTGSVVTITVTAIDDLIPSQTGTAIVTQQQP